MLSKFFAAIARLFGRKKFGGFDAVDSIKTDSHSEWTNKQY
jgi:hypothetical protein